MSNTNTMALRDLRLANYSSLDRQLTRRLGSTVFGSGPLRQIYRRIENFEIGAAPRPKACLFGIALNVTDGRRQAESRRLTVDEVETLLNVCDQRPDAARVTEDGSEVDLLGRAIAELPERRRRVLLLSRIEGLPHREIARRLGITLLAVETDLKQAIEHCAGLLQPPIPAKSALRQS